MYGNRIVLFAPLYIGNECVNDCAYCGFRRSNREAVRRTLDREELQRQVAALEAQGTQAADPGLRRAPALHGRVHRRRGSGGLLGAGGHGEIRRVNINAAPLDHAGLRDGQGSRHRHLSDLPGDVSSRDLCARCIRRRPLKADYLWRLDALDRAWESGCDDVGIGALFGLYDWRFEVLGLVAHARHLHGASSTAARTPSVSRVCGPASGVRLRRALAGVATTTSSGWWLSCG